MADYYVIHNSVERIQWHYVLNDVESIQSALEKEFHVLLRQVEDREGCLFETQLSEPWKDYPWQYWALLD